MLGLDSEASDPDMKQVGFTARQFCKYVQRYGQFLEYKPSQIAAAAIVLSVRLNLSPVGPSVGLKPLRGDVVRQLVARIEYDSMGSAEEGRVFQPKRTKKMIGTLPTDDHLRIGGPLSLWTPNLAQLTGLSAVGDVSQPYQTLLYHLDTFQFKGKLSEDLSLWVQQPLSADALKHFKS